MGMELETTPEHLIQKPVELGKILEQEQGILQLAAEDGDYTDGFH